MPARPILHVEVMVQAHCADRLGGIQDQEHRDIPEPQPQVRAFHYGANRDGELLAARATAIKTGPRRDRRRLIDRATPRTNRTFGPADAFKVRPTGFVGVEFAQERGQLHPLILADCVSKSNKSQCF